MTFSICNAECRQRVEGLMREVELLKYTMEGMNSLGHEKIVTLERERDQALSEVKRVVAKYESDMQHIESAAERIILENDRYKEALESISKNSCCDFCQQAKLVAREALGWERG